MASKPSSRGTARKPAAPRPGTAKSKLVVAEAVADAAPSQPEMKRQELLAQVVKRAEVKKKFAKPVLEAVLEVLGEALAEGRDLNLAPLGKFKINRVRELDNGRVVIARIRQGGGAGTGAAADDDKEMKEVVAEPSE
jgi:DNA-binding protein HU-alpha